MINRHLNSRVLNNATPSRTVCCISFYCQISARVFPPLLFTVRLADLWNFQRNHDAAAATENREREITVKLFSRFNLESASYKLASLNVPSASRFNQFRFHAWILGCSLNEKINETLDVRDQRIGHEAADNLSFQNSRRRSCCSTKTKMEPSRWRNSGWSCDHWDRGRLVSGASSNFGEKI